MRPLITLIAILSLSLAGCLAVKVPEAKGASKTEPTVETGSVFLVGDANWDVDVIQASNEVPVVVDMYADWCGPCKRQAPILDELSGEMLNVKFVKLDVDKATKDNGMGISAIPTLVVYRNGAEVMRWTGLEPKEKIRSNVEAHL